MNAREETMLVKKALIEAGFDKQAVRVGHGTGTALCWLEMKVNMPEGMSYDESYDKAIVVAQRVTGRHGDYSGEINVAVR